MNAGGGDDVEALRLELRAEARAAHRMTWALRVLAVGFAAAYLLTVTVGRQLDWFYLLLTVGTLLSSASQFVYIERDRVPAPLQRLVNTPTPALRHALEALWPEIRASHGRGLAALGPRLFSPEEIAALTLDEALVFLRAAGRRDWKAFARAWTVGLGLVLAGIALACALHVPDAG